MQSPNLEKALKVEVVKSGDEYRADPTALPGSPLVGRGDTEDAAKYNLCVNWLYLFARYHSVPEHMHDRGDYAYIPHIIDLLNKDLGNLRDNHG
jgi:hypothetical protein